MTDKEKIRKEVQRLMNELIQEKEKGHGSDIDDACILELQNVLTYIDSLPKESVSENRKEAILKKAHELANRAELISDKFPKSTLIAVAIDMAEWCDSHPIEEPVSKELEEAAEKYAYELFPSIGVANTETELAFKAGAQWNKSI